MLRSELKLAPYNPRQIDESAKKKLRASIKRVGLVQPITWNARTGNIVAGHQRIAIMDSLEKKDYEIEVAAIDVDEKTEKELNIALNNDLVTGSFDLAKLDLMFKNEGLDLANCGFEPFELAVMLPSFEAPMTPALKQVTGEVTEVLADIEEKKRKGRELKKKIRDGMLASEAITNPEDIDTELFVVLVFPDREMSDIFLQTLKMPTTEKYISGQLVLEALNSILADKT